MIYAALLLLPAFWGVLWLMRRDTLRRGREEQKLEQAEVTLNELKIVKNARDRLRAVNASADKLRDKYTRKP